VNELLNKSTNLKLNLILLEELNGIVPKIGKGNLIQPHRNVIKYEELRSTDNKNYKLYFLSDVLIILDMNNSMLMFIHHIFLKLIKETNTEIILENYANKGKK
jgi:hypothetical protein